MRPSNRTTERGRRPVCGATERFQSAPHWRDSVLFYEYFHGDNGAGVGASHHTGCTGGVGLLIRITETLPDPLGPPPPRERLRGRNHDWRRIPPRQRA
jgi:hypothetical protein